MNDHQSMAMSHENTTEYFVPITFNDAGKRYFFSTANPDFKPGDFVIVETTRGLELGKIVEYPKSINLYSSKLTLKPILRTASTDEYQNYLENLELAKDGLKFTERETQRLGLDMSIISGEYTLDRSKFIVTYLADHRVDFRELLRTMAAKLHTRIELRQIGTRDKAKLIGGVGICGLPICCTTWLNEFGTISINKAKNQMLALNIPKLSGHCGKLICCLAYEDDFYSEAKKGMPKPGLRLTYKDDQYRVSSLNVISRKVVISSSDNRETFELDEYNKLVKNGAIVPSSHRKNKGHGKD